MKYEFHAKAVGCEKLYSGVSGENCAEGTVLVITNQGGSQRYIYDTDDTQAVEEAEAAGWIAASRQSRRDKEGTGGVDRIGEPAARSACLLSVGRWVPGDGRRGGSLALITWGCL
jgi:hypothetical protein